MLAGSFGLLGCGASLKSFPFDYGRTLSTHLGLEVIFYSVCCVQIRSSNSSILCDPFWTHLPLRQVAFGKCLPDPNEIKPHLSEFNDVRGVLIGHNHYDHNMGLSMVDPHLHKEANLLGTQTMKHTFAASSLQHPLIPLNTHIATPNSIGKWWYDPKGHFRILPILSGHPNQYLFFHLFKKELQEDRKSPPKHVSDYQEGITLAFLLDFLDGSKIKQRVYIQSSSTGYPAGFFPAEIKDEKAIDLAIVAMDCANIQMESGASILSFIDAPIVFFNHFEDFFRDKDETPREIVKVNLPKSRDYFRNDSHKYIFSAYNQRYYL